MKVTRYLWINGIPKLCGDDDIRKKFESHGKIQTIRIHDNGNIRGAIISFIDCKSSTKAFESEHLIKDVPVKIEYCEANGEPGLSNSGFTINDIVKKDIESLDHKMRSRSSSNTSSFGSSIDDATKYPDTKSIEDLIDMDNKYFDDKSNKDCRGILLHNLSQRSSDTSLREGLFHEYKKHGKITSVSILGQGTDRRAIISFKRSEDMDKAFDASQGKIFFGNQIKVQKHLGFDYVDPDLCPPEHAMDEYHPKATKTLFVGKLNTLTITESDLRKVFKKYGEIIDIDLKTQSNQPDTSFAFVQYFDIASVVRALRNQDNIKVDGKSVKLGFGKSQPTNCLWIGNVSQRLNSERTLRRQFRRLGNILLILPDSECNCALIQFESVDDAQRALQDVRDRSLAATANNNQNSAINTNSDRRLQVDFASTEYQTAYIERLKKSCHFDASQFLNCAAEICQTEKIQNLLLSYSKCFGMLEDNARQRQHSYDRYDGGAKSDFDDFDDFNNKRPSNRQSRNRTNNYSSRMYNNDRDGDYNDDYHRYPSKNRSNNNRYYDDYSPSPSHRYNSHSKKYSPTDSYRNNRNYSRENNYNTVNNYQNSSGFNRSNSGSPSSGEFTDEYPRKYSNRRDYNRTNTTNRGNNENRSRYSTDRKSYKKKNNSQYNSYHNSNNFQPSPSYSKHSSQSPHFSTRRDNRSSRSKDNNETRLYGNKSSNRNNSRNKRLSSNDSITRYSNHSSKSLNTISTTYNNNKENGHKSLKHDTISSSSSSVSNNTIITNPNSVNNATNLNMSLGSPTSSSLSIKIEKQQQPLSSINVSAVMPASQSVDTLSKLERERAKLLQELSLLGEDSMLANLSNSLAADTINTPIKSESKTHETLPSDELKAVKDVKIEEKLTKSFKESENKCSVSSTSEVSKSSVCQIAPIKSESIISTTRDPRFSSTHSNAVPNTLSIPLNTTCINKRTHSTAVVTPTNAHSILPLSSLFPCLSPLNTGPPVSPPLKSSTKPTYPSYLSQISISESTNFDNSMSKSISTYNISKNVFSNFTQTLMSQPISKLTNESDLDKRIRELDAKLRSATSVVTTNSNSDLKTPTSATQSSASTRTLDYSKFRIKKKSNVNVNSVGPISPSVTSPNVSTPTAAGNPNVVPNAVDNSTSSIASTRDFINSMLNQTKSKTYLSETLLSPNPTNFSNAVSSNNFKVDLGASDIERRTLMMNNSSVSSFALNTTTITSSAISTLATKSYSSINPIIPSISSISSCVNSSTTQPTPIPLTTSLSISTSMQLPNPSTPLTLTTGTGALSSCSTGPNTPAPNDYSTTSSLPTPTKSILKKTNQVSGDSNTNSLISPNKLSSALTQISSANKLSHYSSMTSSQETSNVSNSVEISHSNYPPYYHHHQRIASKRKSNSESSDSDVFRLSQPSNTKKVKTDNGLTLDDSLFNNHSVTISKKIKKQVTSKSFDTNEKNEKKAVSSLVPINKKSQMVNKSNKISKTMVSNDKIKSKVNDTKNFEKLKSCKSISQGSKTSNVTNNQSKKSTKLKNKSKLLLQRTKKQKSHIHSKSLSKESKRNGRKSMTTVDDYETECTEEEFDETMYDKVKRRNQKAKRSRRSNLLKRTAKNSQNHKYNYHSNQLSEDDYNNDCGNSYDEHRSSDEHEMKSKVRKLESKKQSYRHYNNLPPDDLPKLEEEFETPYMSGIASSQSSLEDDPPSQLESMYDAGNNPNNITYQNQPIVFGGSSSCVSTETIPSLTHSIQHDHHVSSSNVVEEVVLDDHHHTDHLQLQQSSIIRDCDETETVLPADVNSASQILANMRAYASPTPSMTTTTLNQIDSDQRFDEDPDQVNSIQQNVSASDPITVHQSIAEHLISLSSQKIANFHQSQSNENFISKVKPRSSVLAPEDDSLSITEDEDEIEDRILNQKNNKEAHNVNDANLSMVPESSNKPVISTANSHVKREVTDFSNVDAIDVNKGDDVHKYVRRIIDRVMLESEDTKGSSSNLKLKPDISSIDNEGFNVPTSPVNNSMTSSIKSPHYFEDTKRQNSLMEETGSNSSGRRSRHNSAKSESQLQSLDETIENVVKSSLSGGSISDGLSEVASTIAEQQLHLNQTNEMFLLKLEDTFTDVISRVVNTSPVVNTNFTKHTEMSMKKPLPMSTTVNSLNSSVPNMTNSSLANTTSNVTGTQQPQTVYIQQPSVSNNMNVTSKQTTQLPSNIVLSIPSLFPHNTSLSSPQHVTSTNSTGALVTNSPSGEVLIAKMNQLSPSIMIQPIPHSANTSTQSLPPPLNHHTVRTTQSISNPQIAPIHIAPHTTPSVAISSAPTTPRFTIAPHNASLTKPVSVNLMTPPSPITTTAKVLPQEAVMNYQLLFRQAIQNQIKKHPLDAQNTPGHTSSSTSTPQSIIFSTPSPGTPLFIRHPHPHTATHPQQFQIHPITTVPGAPTAMASLIPPTSVPPHHLPFIAHLRSATTSPNNPSLYFNNYPPPKFEEKTDWLVQQYQKDKDDKTKLNPYYPIKWTGKLCLKNGEIFVQMHLLGGNEELIRIGMGMIAHQEALSNNTHATTTTAPLRIVQRMRLEPSQLEGLQRRLTRPKDYCTCLTLAGGESESEVDTTSISLNDNFIKYLQEKSAAGIINIQSPETQQNAYVIHIFPPCEFSDNQLMSCAGKLYDQLKQNNIPYLVVVITVL